ncbi:hypothetical protein GQ43DRAFT_444403 [Delitschia confertaspora ATCC 74209]|uniref:Uncharacterized protein n=1 Tax=Delitschia confertaspora ATCC 74209 TaxID=1513339 RepID=A0A9P4JG02_9PLEO|nr:hypothetical protein GQ43DRAFT_444403 [Delitschia confertaspora ATCC 74209]
MSFGFGTEFVSVLNPPQDLIKDWDHTKRHDQQTSTTVPPVFRDALAVREEVFVNEQGVPLEVEVDEDDKRSWHWVVKASVATISPPSEQPNPIDDTDSRKDTKEEGERRASATASQVPVATIRLIPPPHGPNPYKNESVGDKHPDADPPAEIQATVERKHPTEPYIKLGRLATLKAYRGLGLSGLLIRTALDYAAKHPTIIVPAPSPTTVEQAKAVGKDEDAFTWKGLIMIHAQVAVERMWARHGFVEELINEKGEVEISKEDRWFEEGIEHLAMWKRITVVQPTL